MIEVRPKKYMLVIGIVTFMIFISATVWSLILSYYPGILFFGIMSLVSLYVIVNYEVDGREYQIKESIKYKSKAIKLGFLPVGQKKVPVMGDTSVGSPAFVCYDPENPQNAFLKDNKGRVNV